MRVKRRERRKRNYAECVNVIMPSRVLVVHRSCLTSGVSAANNDLHLRRNSVDILEAIGIILLTATP